VSLEGNGEEGLEKKKEGVSGRNRGYRENGLWGLIFLQNIKPSSFEELKNCIRGGFFFFLGGGGWC